VPLFKQGIRPEGKTMDSYSKNIQVRWAFVALVFLGMAVTLTLFKGLQV
jgi:hypothetical protein